MNLKLLNRSGSQRAGKRYYQLSSLNPFRSCVLNGFLAFQHIINQRFVHKFCAPSINFYIVDVSFSCFQKETTPTTLFHLFSTIKPVCLLFQKTPASNRNNNFFLQVFFSFFLQQQSANRENRCFWDS